jgi:hypothetical protein
MGAKQTLSRRMLNKAILKSLHADLHPYILQDAVGKIAICAPLCSVLPGTLSIDGGPCTFAEINENYCKMRSYAEQKRRERDWFGYIDLHERHFRIEAFGTIASQLTDAEYWGLLAHTWTGAETIWRNNTRWLFALMLRPTSRHLFMTPEDRATFETLPDSFTIYRGYQPGKNADGFSWTLNKGTAEKLSNNGKGANLFDWHSVLEGGEVREKTVNKADVFAYTNNRDEQEIILLWNGREYIRPFVAASDQKSVHIVS